MDRTCQTIQIKLIWEKYRTFYKVVHENLNVSTSFFNKTDWQIDKLIDWMIDWLIDWLAD